MDDKIKQQKAIFSFFIEEFGKEKGHRLFQIESDILSSIINQTTGNTINQMKTLTKTILPRIAMYQTFLKEQFSTEEATTYMRKYMLEVVAAKKHSTNALLEKIPGFYRVYSNIFLKIMRTTDLQVSNQQKGKNYYNVTITKCLWHTACVDNHCEELCRLFCDVDDISYGGLKKLGFSRTQTLGYGGTCCDFHFYRKA